MAMCGFIHTPVPHTTPSQNDATNGEPRPREVEGTRPHLFLQTRGSPVQCRGTRKHDREQGRKRHPGIAAGRATFPL